MIKVKEVHGLDRSGLIVEERYQLANGTKNEEVEGVALLFQASTSRARVFDIALKLAALNWTDKTIDKVESLVDARLAKLAK